MSCYFVALIDIHDPEKYAVYLAGYDEIFSQYKGEVIAVEDEARILEGEWPAGRTVMIKFPSEDELRKWYDSDEYQALAKYRQEASVAAIAIITGRDD